MTKGTVKVLDNDHQRILRPLTRALAGDLTHVLTCRLLPARHCRRLDDFSLGIIFCIGFEDPKVNRYEYQDVMASERLNTSLPECS